MFQKNAMGRFFKKVPTQIEGSWLTGAPARIHIKKNLGHKAHGRAHYGNGACLAQQPT